MKIRRHVVPWNFPDERPTTLTVSWVRSNSWIPARPFFGFRANLSVRPFFRSDYNVLTLDKQSDIHSDGYQKLRDNILKRNISRKKLFLKHTFGNLLIRKNTQRWAEKKNTRSGRYFTQPTF